MEKIRAIYDFVTTDITYQAWAFGPHGYKPYTTTAIFDKREGDCKDKAILIDTMLREIGIEAYPVLIRGEVGRSEEDLSLAMVGHFNHCISYVPDADGEGNELWLDGTATYHSALLPPAMDRGANVVVITPEGAQEKTIPWGDPDLNGLDQDFTFEIHADGSATAKGELTFRGDGAVFLRRQFSVPGQRPIFLKGWLAQLFGKAELVDFEFDDLKDLSTVAASFRVTVEIQGFAQKEGDAYTLPGSFLDGFPNMAGRVTRPERDHDLILGVPQSMTLKAKYVLPDGWTVEAAPEDVEIAMTAGSFVSKATHEGSQLSLERTFRVTVPRIKASEYPEYREAVNRLSSTSAQRFKVKAGSNGE